VIRDNHDRSSPITCFPIGDISRRSAARVLIRLASSPLNRENAHERAYIYAPLTCACPPIHLVLHLSGLVPPVQNMSTEQYDAVILGAGGKLCAMTASPGHCRQEAPSMT
jgi:hypothetical protein